MTLPACAALLCTLAAFAAAQCPPDDEPATCDVVTGASLDAACTVDSDCAGMSVCIAAKCACRPSDQLRSTSGVCVLAPGFNDPCFEGQCLAPEKCSTSTDHCSECVTPFTVGRSGCELDCTDTQVAGSAACLAKVNALGTGADCTESIQCVVAYSFCDTSLATPVCSCHPGLAATAGVCQIDTADYTCKDGEPPVTETVGGVAVVKKCTALACPIGAGINRQWDSCAADEECLFPTWQLTEGFCCKRETAWCPVGSPLAGKKCGAEVATEDERCPVESHQCYAGESGRAYCCPKPCSVGSTAQSVVIAGVCHKQLKLADDCTVDEECPTNAECKMATGATTGLCTCLDGFTDQGVDSVCTVRCANTKVLVGDTCFDRVVRGADCTYSAQCPHDTQCRRDGGAGGTKKCLCRCGEILYAGSCVPDPQCPAGGIGGGVVPPSATTSGGETFYFPCIPTVRCATGQRPSMCNEHNGCGDGFCQAHASIPAYGGICCPMPAPVCSGGAPPSGTLTTCNLRSASCASSGRICFDFIGHITGDPDTFARKGVCC